MQRAAFVVHAWNGVSGRKGLRICRECALGNVRIVRYWHPETQVVVNQGCKNGTDTPYDRSHSPEIDRREGEGGWEMMGHAAEDGREGRKRQMGMATEDSMGLGIRMMVAGERIDAQVDEPCWTGSSHHKILTWLRLSPNSKISVTNSPHPYLARRTPTSHFASKAYDSSCSCATSSILYFIASGGRLLRHEDLGERIRRCVRQELLPEPTGTAGSCLPSQALAMPPSDSPVTSLCICSTCECMLPLKDQRLVSSPDFSTGRLSPWDAMMRHCDFEAPCYLLLGDRRRGQHTFTSIRSRLHSRHLKMRSSGTCSFLFTPEVESRARDLTIGCG